MTDNQQAESATQRLLRVGTLTLTVLGPVINTLATRLADRLERGGKHSADSAAVDVESVSNKSGNKKIVFTNRKRGEVVAVKQPLSDALLERGEILVQELEDLVERGTKLSQSLLARGSEVTHDLAERGNNASQDLLRRSKEARKELRKRGKKLNKDLNRRSQKVAKELSRRSEKITRDLSKRSRQATRQISEHNGPFWIISGFAVGLAAAGITAYILIQQRVRQQQQLEAEQSFPLSQNGYVSTPTSSVQEKSAYTTSGPVVQQPAQSSIAEENVPVVAVADLESRMPAAQSAPSNAAFIGIIGTRRYYPVSTPPDQLPSSETGKNDIIYFTTEEEAQTQGYSSGL